MNNKRIETGGSKPRGVNAPLELLREMGEIYRTELKQAMRLVFYPQIIGLGSDIGSRLENIFSSLHSHPAGRRVHKMRLLSPQKNLVDRIRRLDVCLRELLDMIQANEAALLAIPEDLLENRLRKVLFSLRIPTTYRIEGLSGSLIIDFSILMQHLWGGKDGVSILKSRITNALRILDAHKKASPIPGSKKITWRTENFDFAGLSAALSAGKRDGSVTSSFMQGQET